MANIEPLNQNLSTSTDEEFSSLSKANTLLSLKIIEYVILAALVGSLVTNIFFPELQLAKLYLIIFAGIWIFWFFLSKQLISTYGSKSEQSDLTAKAKLYASLGNTLSGPVGNFITSARVRALKYCQDLIEDYKKTRKDCRNIYYMSQIATIVLSGITPILVLVDKLETGTTWLKWLPVICPAIAAIVASIVTSFPLQENWVAANAAVELLEAEQEKFILGVSPLYQYASFEEPQFSQEAQKAVENFIVQVNNIHLKQLQAFNEKKQEQKTEESEASSETNQG